MLSSPLKVGITGGIGAGKSIVCKVFGVLGIPVYDADRRAKQLMQKSPSVIDQIKERFGQASYDNHGILNRSFLASEVFNDKKKLEVLNAIVHPAVESDFQNWIPIYSDCSYIIKEAALLVETGSYKRLDYLIAVTSPEEVRVRRILERDKQRSINDIRSIISNQLAEKEIIEAAQFIIENDGQTLLLPQVLKIHEFFINLE
jgi:dephospho-CoA kinase